MQSKPPSPRYRSMLRDGWWIGLTALLIITVGTIWQVTQSLGRERLIGDGVNPETYGFDLSNLKVPRKSLAAYARRDEVPVLTNPEFISVAEVERINREEHGKFLVPTDRVIGVEYEGQSRAYPLKVMAVHEVVNDELGGKPLVVFYSGLGDVALVYDREHNRDSSGSFIHSGLVFNSVPLLVDEYKLEEKDAALRSLLLDGLGIKNPHHGGPWGLSLIPCRVMQWRDWLALHPETTVIARRPELYDSYRHDHYGPYWQTNDLRFPVSPLPPEELNREHGLHLKSRIMGFNLSSNQASSRGAVPYDAVLREAVFNEAGLGTWHGWVDELDITVTFHCRRADVGFAPPTVWFVENLEWPSEWQVLAPCCLWFAWYSHHPHTIVIDLPPNGTPRPGS